MDSMINIAPKAGQMLQVIGGYCIKISVTKLKVITFWFFYKEVTGRNSIIVKKI